ncbi:hypothetical protein ACE1CI_36650, partial [Aerosakkonemataceae cyanobacterium BLCC-F50]
FFVLGGGFTPPQIFLLFCWGWGYAPALVFTLFTSTYLHGDTVTAQSPSEGQETTFVVELPLLKDDKVEKWQSKGGNPLKNRLFVGYQTLDG